MFHYLQKVKSIHHTSFPFSLTSLCILFFFKITNTQGWGEEGWSRFRVAFCLEKRNSRKHVLYISTQIAVETKMFTMQWTYHFKFTVEYRLFKPPRQMSEKVAFKSGLDYLLQCFLRVLLPKSSLVFCTKIFQSFFNCSHPPPPDPPARTPMMIAAYSVCENSYLTEKRKKLKPQLAFNCHSFLVNHNYISLQR